MSTFGRAARSAFRLFLLLLGSTVAAWIASRPAAPDDFYRHELPQEARPGAFLKSEPFSTAVPEGARGWRILYVTARGGKPSLASAVVVAPSQLSDQLLPVVAWAHGTTGVASGCAPSLLAKPFDNVPGIERLVREGLVYVGTDYPGLGTDGGHAYLVGEDAARAVLDAVRAARQMPDLKLDQRFVVWGHSQGGNAALWTGILASQYAPELKLTGVAALAPASELAGLIASSKGSIFGKIVSSYLVHGYAQAYPDVKVDAYLGDFSRIVASDIATRCVGGYATIFSLMEAFLLPSSGMFSQDPTTGPLGARLAQNTPTRAIRVPVLIAQGKADDLVVAVVQERYVASRCAAGQHLDYRTYAGRDHISLVAPDSPLTSELLAWTRERLAGIAAGGNCRSAAQ